MLIVIFALLLIACFIAVLPKILQLVAKVLPESDLSHAHESHPESLRPDDDAVLAAIGFVLHTEFQRQVRSSGKQSQ